ncbi:Autophagy-related protein 27 [Phaffia rhodozyma]|uniref:Autophagy-related protein 27 n=1 Tax=Phaffia rhodozyma TaxID=264483 RepID=A0A0F7SH96_PHARH|nr:Autophagy-related protein 27 [Phaffia rhodozyma]
MLLLPTSALLLSSLALFANAQAHVSCVISKSAGLSNTYDLSLLGQDVHRAGLTEPTPPTQTLSTVRLILCGGEGKGLELEDGVEQADQCPLGTTVCLRVENIKLNSDPRSRTISVIPIAGSNIPGIDLPGQVIWGQHQIDCPQGQEKGKKCYDVIGNYTGGEWNNHRQKLSIALRCVPSEQSEKEPEFLSYSDSVLSLIWRSEHACPKALDSDDGSSDEGNSNKKRSSGFWGWFFFLLLLVPPIYLGLGIYHNRTTYDAKGWDMVPHRQFWQDFPGLVIELFNHLTSNFRRTSRSSSSSNRGGYESL